MYIKAYSGYMAYSGIFRTGDIFSQLQAHYSGITQEQFMHILNLIQADSGIFRTLTYLGTHMQAYSTPLNMSLSMFYAKQKIFKTGTKDVLFA